MPASASRTSTSTGSRMQYLRAILICLTTLGTTTAASADLVVFDCVGKESIYTPTFEEHQTNLIERSAAVRLEIDRKEKTMSLKGTTNADGRGPLNITPASFNTSYTKPMIIYEVHFKHVLINLAQTKNELAVIASTHLDLSAPDAEGRLLFRGICRLPSKA